MHIGVYGSGYLATIGSACLADFGTPVTCYDKDTERVFGLAEGNVPFYEKNLQDVIRRNVRAGRLIYSTDQESFARKSQVIFLAQDSQRYIEDMALNLAQMASPETIFVVMTPSPVGTARRIEQRLTSAGLQQVVVTQPVFLTDGCAVEDFNWPDRIVLGADSPQAVLTLKQIYRPLVMRGVPVIVTNHETAELVREASTAFVATKISFINELASLCEHVKADSMDLALALGLDKKIGPRCLQPGAALGGSFVESEMESLAELAYGNGVSLKVLTAAREVNRALCDTVVSKISSLVHNIAGKEVGILGLAFKPHTSSVAGSASLTVARKLASAGARVRAYDPVAQAEAREQLQSAVRFCETPYLAAEGADALVVGTGWPEFRSLDFDKIKKQLRQPIIIDTKNLLDGAHLRSMGFQYAGVGRA
ncbi:MAG TPA: nucleotide sugar dehydrogenase [Terriglobales bacterium]|nr:nucleotide sugar dehydrogenase [Terriglobales bacterium]